MANGNGARPADVAVAGNRMILALLGVIWKRRYRDAKPHNMGASLELMIVSMQVSVFTRDGAPPTASELAAKVRMPRSNVLRHLARLIKQGAVTLVDKRYHADLDALDSFVLSRAHLDNAIIIVGECYAELKRLRTLLADVMIDE